MIAHSIGKAPSAYNVRLESSETDGVYNQLVWDGLASEVSFLVRVFIVGGDLAFKDALVPFNSAIIKKNWSRWAEVKGTSIMLDDVETGLPVFNNRKAVPYCFQVCCISGLRPGTVWDETMEDLIYSEPVLLYSYLTREYRFLLDDSGARIKTQLPGINWNLKWVINGEPLSAGSRSIPEDALNNVGRVVGADIADTVHDEFLDGTLNRLPKQLLSNDIVHDNEIRKVVAGIPASLKNLNKNLSRGVVANVCIIPDVSSNTDFDATYNTYPPKIMSNSESVFGIGEYTYMHRVSGGDDLWLSPAIKGGFSFNLFPQPELLVEGKDYLVEVELSYNQVYGGSARGGVNTYTSEVEFMFDNLASDNKEQSIVIRNISQIHGWYQGKRQTGYRTNQYSTRTHAGHMVIKPSMDIVDGVVVNAPTTCTFTCKSKDGKPTPLGATFIHLTVKEL